MSLTFKMAPWPEQGNEPKAPDKSCSKGVENNPSDPCKVDSGVQEEHEAKAVLGKTDDKQDDKNSGVSDLDDGQLRALLDEAITYKCPKDREGKSNLFRELLEEVEAESDGGEESNPTPFGIVDHSRGGKRRRRDAAVSERQTRGGSLQNIVQAYSDFESVYLGGRSKKSLGGGRKKSEFYHYGLGPGSSGVGACGRAGSIGGSGSGGGGSVSARQREGGSLPCNVNAGGGGVGCGGAASECPFERAVRRRRSEHQGSWDENVMPAHMDRGGGGPVSVPTPADVAGRSEAGSDSVGEVVKSGSATSPDEPSGNLVTVVVGEGVSNGVSDDGSPRSSESKDSKAEGGGSEVSTGVELRACYATLLSSPVEDGSGDGVELLDLNVTEDRDGGRKSKGECCGRGASDASGSGAEPLITASVPPMSSSPVAVSSSTNDRKGRREVTRGESVDTVVPFSLLWDEKKPLSGGNSGSVVLDLAKGLVNGTETQPLQLASSYPSVKSLVGSSTSPVSSMSDSGAASSAATHVGCSDSPSVQTGVSDDSSGTCGSGKEMTIKKLQIAESQPKPLMPTQVPYSMAIPGHHLSVLAYPPNNWLTSQEPMSRIIPGTKDLNDVKCKSLDENGNAVTMSQGLNKDAHEKGKGKTRRPKTNNDRNTFMSHAIAGFRGDQDLECLLKFIGMDEDKKSKNTNSGAVERVRRSNLRRESDRNIVSNDVGSGRVRATRDRNTTSEDKDDINNYGSSASGGGKGSSGAKVGRAGVAGKQQQQIQHGNKMKKSNSLEEISKTKSEDLTASSVKNDQGNSVNKYPAANVSTVDNDASKSTKEAAQSINKSGNKQESVEISAKDEDVSNHNEKVNKGDHNGNSESNSKADFSAGNRTLTSTSFKEDFYAVTDANPQVLEETEFHVVTKKHRRKKRRAGMGDGPQIERHGVHNSRDSYSYGGNGSNEDHIEEFKRGVSRNDGGNYLDADGKDSVWEGGASGDGRFLGSYTRHHRRHRSQRSNDRLKSTSSVPPSEHSEESSDDSDSVHSLPVSSSVPRPPVDPSSTSSGSTPQASYADIARMASSGPMPVTTGNQGNSPSGVHVSNTLSAQKSKISPVSSESHAQVTVPHVSSPNTLVVASLPYIGSAKVSIGTPPVSGSKAGNHGTFSGDNPVSPNNLTPKSESQAPVTENPEKVQESDSSATHNPTPLLTQLVEPHKKDAMTSTTLDGKTVSSNYSYTVLPSLPAKVEGDAGAANVSPNILEDYYPSLQESLHEKVERRNGKSTLHQVQSSKTTEEKRSSKSITSPSPSTATSSESKASEIENVNMNPVSGHNIVEKTSAQSVEKPPTAMGVKTKEPSVTSTRIRSSGKKPGFRSLPPVVIMDHHYKQEAALKDGAAGNVSESGSASTSSYASADIGGFTFGFEVNEELLGLSSNSTSSENALSEASSLPDDGGKKQNGSLSVVEEELPPPVSTSPGPRPVPGKDAIPVYRTPEELDTKRFNYEKIVSFIGLSWEDVLKEMSVPVKHSNSRVQYYGGQ